MRGGRVARLPSRSSTAQSAVSALREGSEVIGSIARGLIVLVELVFIIILVLLMVVVAILIIAWLASVVARLLEWSRGHRERRG